MDSLIKRYPLLAFFVLAYAITWLAVIPFALGAFPVPMFPFGPLVAAIIVATVCGGWLGTRSLLLRMVQWRAAPQWYAFALLLPAAVALDAAYISVVVFGASDPTSSILAALPGLIPAFVLMMLNPLQGSMGEEPGWCGFALPLLLANSVPHRVEPYARKSCSSRRLAALSCSRRSPCTRLAASPYPYS
jgi:hypothetical protein